MTQRNWFNHTLMIIVALAVAFGTFPNGALAQSATNSSPMKIGIIGSGNIGSTLGTLVG